MKNTQFTPLSKQEMLDVNGGGVLDNVPVVGGLLGGLLGNVGNIPVVGGLLSNLLNTVSGLLNSLLGGLNLPI